MKTRNDFVTNSSSSSFLVAYRDGISEKQKIALAEAVLPRLLGEAVLDADSSPEDIRETAAWGWKSDQREEKIRAALKEGLQVHEGEVSFEETEYCYANLLQVMWEALERAGDGKFVTIDTDLDY